MRRVSLKEKAEAVVGGREICIILVRVSQMLFPEDYCEDWRRVSPQPHEALLLEIKRGRFPRPLKFNRAVRARISDVRVYIARMSTIKERDHYMNTVLAKHRGYRWDECLLSLMARLREGWNPWPSQFLGS